MRCGPAGDPSYDRVLEAMNLAIEYIALSQLAKNELNAGIADVCGREREVVSTEQML